MRSARSAGAKDTAAAKCVLSYGTRAKDDINATLKTMTAEQVGRVDGEPFLGTFVRFNASPWFTTRILDLIGVKDRRYLDATATHRNRGPEDIARYGILVTVAEDGAIGPHTFLSAADRALRYRYSDEAMLALGNTSTHCSRRRTRTSRTTSPPRGRSSSVPAAPDATRRRSTPTTGSCRSAGSRPSRIRRRRRPRTSCARRLASIRGSR